MEEFKLTPPLSCLLVILLTITFWMWRRSQSCKKQLVGYVSEIRTHPVKSAKPLHYDEIEVTPLGLEHDRQFALLNQYGTFVTLRKHPKFVLINQKIVEDSICLKVDGMPDLYLPLFMEKKDGDHMADVTVWRITTEGVHVSEEADLWFAKYLGLEGCKLYCYPVDGVPRKSKLRPQVAEKQFGMMFPDGCPLLIASEASLESLNQQFTEDELVMDRFRPNIVLDGCKAFEEDTFELIQIGDKVTMEGLWACGRCVAINVDPHKGEMGDADLMTFLNKNRPGTIYNPDDKSGIFGYNYGVLNTGNIKVGDPVYKIIK